MVLELACVSDRYHTLVGLFFEHPPVQCTAPSVERYHGYATVRNDLTCRSVRGRAQTLPPVFQQRLVFHAQNNAARRPMHPPPPFAQAPGKSGKRRSDWVPVLRQSAASARRAVPKRVYVTENLPIPHPKHNCRDRALEHNVQHFSASSGGPHCPSGASAAVE